MPTPDWSSVHMLAVCCQLGTGVHCTEGKYSKYSAQPRKLSWHVGILKQIHPLGL